MSTLPPSSDSGRAEERPSSLTKRLAWMAAIWAGSVAAIGAVAMVIRFWISPS